MDADEPQQRPLDRGLVLLLAATCGASVASIYYVQPLLDTLASKLDVSDGTAGLLVTAAQVGYLVGLVLLVPLGDLLERRSLISRVLALSALTLLACAAAPSFAVLAAVLVVVGLTSTVAQVVVPLSSTLAAPYERGQVVGTVMSGLLMGILLARTLSGLLAEIGGWRLVFAVPAVALLLLSLLLWRRLPTVPPTETLRYPQLLASVARLVREEPQLAQRMAMGALHMGGFSALWTAIAFLLAREPYGYGDGTIGLFGLAGLVGAMVAPMAGRLADRGHGQVANTAFLVLVALSWGLLELGGSVLVALIAGIVLFDLGIQGAQISNQSAVYALRPEARSRITTAYMTAVFVGAVVGSAAAAAVYSAAGWDGVCALGAGMALTGLGFWLLVARPTAARATARQ
ncbi:MFS transporter [Patulibacter defluvii]|uniref:MFS transporter n=1 Tax=Patulibacter defluvii TaxID=3095358 RepID=UPI002A76101F|nr:MFS transporter [Patulibacter sp. DM4]